MVVINVASQYLAQVLLIENDDVIQAFATNGSDKPLAAPILPRRAKCSLDLIDTQRHRTMRRLSSEDRVVVSNQKARSCRAVHTPDGESVTLK